MSGERNRSGDRGNSRTDGGAGPSDGTAQPGAAQPHGGYAQGGGNVDFKRFGKLGVAVYGVLALGLVLTNFLATSMEPASSGDVLYGAITYAFNMLQGSTGVLVGLGLGVYLLTSVEFRQSGSVVAAVTAAIGSGVVLVVLALLVMLLAPGPGQVELGDLLAPAIGAVIGITATASGSAYAADTLPDF